MQPSATFIKLDFRQSDRESIRILSVCLPRVEGTGSWTVFICPLIFVIERQLLLFFRKGWLGDARGARASAGTRCARWIFVTLLVHWNVHRSWLLALHHSLIKDSFRADKAGTNSAYAWKGVKRSSWCAETSSCTLHGKLGIVYRHTCGMTIGTLVVSCWMIFLNSSLQCSALSPMPKVAEIIQDRDWHLVWY